MSAPPERRDDAYAAVLVDALKSGGIELVVGLPDSMLKHAHAAVAADPDLRYVAVANEAEMPGIVAGAHLGGVRGVMMMENSGIRQACEPIARFALTHAVPMVIVMPYRGDLGEPFWWGHSHAQTMEPILRALRIPFWHIRRLEDLATAPGRAWVHAETSQYPVALILGAECAGPA